MRKRNLSGKTRGQSRWWLVPTLATALLCSSALGAERVVICEEFTDNECGYCPYAGQALDWMMNDPNDQIVDGTFTLVQIHTNDTAYGIPQWSARTSFYGVTGTPTAVFDGAIWVVGTATNVQTQFNTYMNRYNQRRAVPTDVTITSTGTEVIGQTYTVTARICIEPDGVGKTMRIYMAQVLDRFGCSYCRYTFMQAATTQDVTLSPGGCAVVSRTFTFNSTSWNAKQNIKIIIWAQEPQSSGPQSNPADVYQAHTMHWPFPGPDCNVNGVPDADDIAEGTSEDCNDNGIPDECDIWYGGSPDANSNGIPDECEILTGDVNCDGSVNFGDINPFVLMMTSPYQWQQAYPDCFLLNGDCNLDGAVSFADINPFIALLSGD